MQPQTMHEPVFLQPIYDQATADMLPVASILPSTSYASSSGVFMHALPHTSFRVGDINIDVPEAHRAVRSTPYAIQPEFIHEVQVDPRFRHAPSLVEDMLAEELFVEEVPGS
ncbi:hypothetical protein OBBRIDRAFT_459080 [Obba rivulosa]|uniref:Uncharacterized protein n=1 Tax=Obba rivulosa TaxID=1052685 RepID=A0A8E2AGD7_9APHY|nr:hypothetical protein OBBRIDRAFT_459080 [Obba rivulosa]